MPPMHQTPTYIIHMADFHRSCLLYICRYGCCYTYHPDFKPVNSTKHAGAGNDEGLVPTPIQDICLINRHPGSEKTIYCVLFLHWKQGVGYITIMSLV